MAPKPTVKDVAELSGVSTYTVSRALSGKLGVSEVTRSTVLKAARQIGYVRNEVAASLRSHVSRAVGILTASDRNQYYATLTQSVDEHLVRNGYFAIANDTIRDAEYSKDRELESVTGLLAQRPAAIIATYSLSAESIALIDSFGIPTVFVDSPPPSGFVGRPYVGSNNYHVGRLAGDYLGHLGHRSAMLLAFPQTWTTRAPRISGFVDAAAERGMSVTVLESGNSPESAFDAAMNYLTTCGQDGLPDAVFALNALLVHGAFRALRTLGLEIGPQVSLIGVDDFDWAPLLTPALTVVHQDISTIGATAAEMTLQLINEEEQAGGGFVEVPSSLVIRGSCTPRTTSS